MRTNSIRAEVIPSEHEGGATATYPYDFLALFMQGVRRMAEIQKKALELAYKQHLLVLENHKKTARNAPTVRNRIEIAKFVLDGHVQAQKQVIDSLVERTDEIVGASKRGFGVTIDYTNAVQQAIDRSATRESEVLCEALSAMHEKR